MLTAFSNLAYSTPLSAQPQPAAISVPPGTAPDMSQMDPSAYMSPMDLYDSIFWGKPARCCFPLSRSLVLSLFLPRARALLSFFCASRLMGLTGTDRMALVRIARSLLYRHRYEFRLHGPAPSRATATAAVLFLVLRQFAGTRLVGLFFPPDAGVQKKKGPGFVCQPCLGPFYVLGL